MNEDEEREKARLTTEVRQKWATVESVVRVR